MQRSRPLPVRQPQSTPSDTTEAALRAAAEAIERLQFGVVQLVVHDGRVVQLEVTERQRFV
ncbi:MAG: DUF2292 domain-containing protein [Sphingomonadaceae bacterium]|nr:DUF2292 domain-containing protein [Sphingomonadaceae bacterium]